jgi:hypothetical protein
MLERLDAFLIDRVAQPIVNRFEVRPSAAACMLVDGSAMFMVASAVADGGFLNVAIACWIALLVVRGIRGTALIGPAQRRIGLYAMVRVGIFTLAVASGLTHIALGWTLADLLDQAGITLYAAALYVQCCRKPPPRERREWAPVGMRPAWNN